MDRYIFDGSFEVKFPFAVVRLSIVQIIRGLNPTFEEYRRFVTRRIRMYCIFVFRL